MGLGLDHDIKGKILIVGVCAHFVPVHQIDAPASSASIPADKRRPWRVLMYLTAPVGTERFRRGSNAVGIA